MLCFPESGGECVGPSRSWGLTVKKRLMTQITCQFAAGRGVLTHTIPLGGVGYAQSPVAGIPDGALSDHMGFVTVDLLS